MTIRREALIGWRSYEEMYGAAAITAGENDIPAKPEERKRKPTCLALRTIGLVLSVKARRRKHRETRANMARKSHDQRWRRIKQSAGGIHGHAIFLLRLLPACWKRRSGVPHRGAAARLETGEIHNLPVVVFWPAAGLFGVEKATGGGLCDTFLQLGVAKCRALLKAPEAKKHRNPAKSENNIENSEETQWLPHAKEKRRRKLWR